MESMTYLVSIGKKKNIIIITIIISGAKIFLVLILPFPLSLIIIDVMLIN